MSAENVELIRSALGAMGLGDLDRSSALMHPEIEWHMAEDEPEARTLHGAAEVREMLAGYASAFAEFSGEPQEFIDAGNHVVVPIVFTARPHGGEGSVRIDETQVFEIRDG